MRIDGASHSRRGHVEIGRISGFAHGAALLISTVEVANWSNVPFGSQASYCGVRLNNGVVEEHDDERSLVQVPIDDTTRLILEHGQPAERPILQAFAGFAITAAGLFGGGGQLRTLALSDEFSPILMIAAVCVLGLGIWMLSQLTRKRWYLRSASPPRRKLIFDSSANEQGLSIFLTALKKGNLSHVELPGDFLTASRFCSHASLHSPALTQVRHSVSSANLKSFSFRVQDKLTFLAQPLTEWLQSYLKQGVQIQDRDTLTYGIFILMAEVTDGELTLLAPTADPTQWEEDLTPILLGTARQRFVAESLSPEPELDLPRIDKLVGIAASAVEGPVFMARQAPDPDIPDHSGWFVWSVADNDTDERDRAMVHVPLAELIAIRPDLTEFLALPTDYSVGFVGETPQVLLGESELEPLDGSYLHAKINGVEVPLAWQGTA